MDFSNSSDEALSAFYESVQRQVVADRSSRFQFIGASARHYADRRAIVLAVSPAPVPYRASGLVRWQETVIGALPAAAGFTPIFEVCDA